jgi:phospholipid/cholesterol/gamma-HCH transport system ATP-binding protein
MGMDNTAPLVIQDLTKSFGNQPVLKKINLEVAEGETVAVLGKSGGGKSVLLKLIVGLQPADGGSIRVEGKEIGQIPRPELNEVRKKIGFLFQQAALYDSLTVECNVAFPLERHTQMPENERLQKARELLKNVGMEQDFGKMPSEISGGMQKRVGLARALALEPIVLLFDEPTAGLDPITASEIAGLIVHLKEDKKRAAIVVTHDIHSAKVFADRLVLLQEGSIVMQGTFDDLQKSDSPFVNTFLRQGGVSEKGG